MRGAESEGAVGESRSGEGETEDGSEIEDVVEVVDVVDALESRCACA